MCLGAAEGGGEDELSERFKKMLMKDLQAELSRRGARTSGKKSVLHKRLAVRPVLFLQRGAAAVFLQQMDGG